MKCPYCHNEMLEGYILPDRSALQWIPVNENPATFVWGTAKGAIKLTRVSGLTVPKKEAFACKECHVIIIKYEDLEK